MENNDLTVEAKRKPVIMWKKSVDTLSEFRALMSIMRKNSVINDFLNNHTLYGEEITHNACYNLVIKENVAYVYLNMDAVSIGNNVATA